MTVILGSTVGSIATLSDRAVAALALIPDAMPWFEWAASDPTESFSFANEADLVGRILPILHGTDVLSLDSCGVQLSPLALSELDRAELDLLLVAEQGDADATAAQGAREMLMRRGFVTRSQFDATQAFLEETDAAGLLFLETSTLRGRIALAREVAAATGPEGLDKRALVAAVRFAAQFAQTTDGFADHVTVYRILAGRLGLTPAKAMRAAHQARAALVPRIGRHLRCPRFATAPTGEDLGADLRSWSSGGFGLGFRSIASGLRTVAAYTDGSLGENDEARTATDKTVATVQRLAMGGTPASVSVTQDGCLAYVIEDDDRRLTLLLDHAGDLTVESLERLTYAPESPSPKENAR